jgi:hypothetical protein
MFNAEELKVVFRVGESNTRGRITVGPESIILAGGGQFNTSWGVDLRLHHTSPQLSFVRISLALPQKRWRCLLHDNKFAATVFFTEESLEEFRKRLSPYFITSGVRLVSSNATLNSMFTNFSPSGS